MECGEASEQWYRVYKQSQIEEAEGKRRFHVSYRLIPFISPPIYRTHRTATLVGMRLDNTARITSLKMHTLSCKTIEEYILYGVSIENKIPGVQSAFIEGRYAFYPKVFRVNPPKENKKYRGRSMCWIHTGNNLVFTVRSIGNLVYDVYIAKNRLSTNLPPIHTFLKVRIKPHESVQILSKRLEPDNGVNARMCKMIFYKNYFGDE